MLGVHCFQECDAQNHGEIAGASLLRQGRFENSLKMERKYYRTKAESGRRTSPFLSVFSLALIPSCHKFIRGCVCEFM